MPSTTPDLSISIPPLLNREVDYLSDISVPIQIKNSSTGPAMIELITLRFQSDWNVPGPDVAITEHFTDFTLDPDVLGYRNIKVVPHLVYRRYSNFFDVLLNYRLKEKSGFAYRKKFRSAATDNFIAAARRAKATQRKHQEHQSRKPEFLNRGSKARDRTARITTHPLAA